MKRILTLTGTMMLCAAAALADTQGFRSIADAAGKIEAGANSIVTGLKKKNTTTDRDAMKTQIESIGQELSALKSTVAELDRDAAAKLTESQRKQLEQVKVRVELMEVFHDQKSKLASEDFDANRKQIEQAAHGLMIRARALQKTVSKL